MATWQCGVGSNTAGRSEQLRAAFFSATRRTLAPFLNVANRSDFVLVMAWLLAALRGPFPLLAVSGEQGSAKTVFSKIASRVD